MLFGTIILNFAKQRMKKANGMIYKKKLHKGSNEIKNTYTTLF